MKFDACMQTKLQSYVDRFVNQALNEAAHFIKESVLVKPNQQAMKRAMKKQKIDPFAGKEMNYITEDLKSINPHLEDAYLMTPTLPSQRLLFGEPIELEQWEVDKW